MNNTPINYSFVTRKKLSITEDDGSTNNYTILVLDEEANDSYFRKIASFKQTVEKNFSSSDEISHWEVSESFIDLAVDDFMREEFIENARSVEDPNSLGPTILNFPVKPIKSETPVCFLVGVNGNKVENTFF